MQPRSRVSAQIGPDLCHRRMVGSAPWRSSPSLPHLARLTVDYNLDACATRATRDAIRQSSARSRATSARSRSRQEVCFASSVADVARVPATVPSLNSFRVNDQC